MALGSPEGLGERSVKVKPVLGPVEPEVPGSNPGPGPTNGYVKHIRGTSHPFR